MYFGNFSGWPLLHTWPITCSNAFSLCFQASDRAAAWIRPVSLCNIIQFSLLTFCRVVLLTCPFPVLQKKTMPATVYVARFALDFSFMDFGMVCSQPCLAHEENKFFHLFENHPAIEFCVLVQFDSTSNLKVNANSLFRATALMTSYRWIRYHMENMLPFYHSNYTLPVFCIVYISALIICFSHHVKVN